MTRFKFGYLLVALLGAALLGGCGSSGGSSDTFVATPAGGNLGTDANGIFFTGSASCATCHQNPAVVGAEFTAPLEKYRQSKHLLHSTQISAAAPALCLNCHDPLGDGRTLQSLVPAANVPAGGLAAVGCENCHGAGGEHFGAAPVPNVTPDFTVCGNCHNAGLPVGPAGHVGTGVGGILENYQASRHASSVRGGATNPVCARCHSDEGFRQNFAATAGLETADFVAFLNGVAAPAVRSAVQCRTCHDPHSGAMRAAATVDAATTAVVFSSEFNLCTSCHQVFLTTTFDEVSGTFSYQTDTARTHYLASGHPTATALIEDTHFANAAGTIAGYNINAAAGNACTACHDPHGATKFAQLDASAIATAWGTSGHADYQGEPFGPGITQAACLKCHSGPQNARFVQGVAPADLDPAHGAQVVSCVACHDTTARDATGAFVLGALRSVPTVTFPSGAEVSLTPESNICMECHQGRSSKPTVDARIAAGNLSFSNIHYFAAAATLFGSEVQGGYEYPGRTYRGRNAFTPHAILGRPDLTTCAGCHLRGTEVNHTFIPSLATCNACHPGASFQALGGSPQFNFGQINQLKDQLLGLLTASGVVALDGFPYFQNITTEQQLKAAYNWQVADKEPCGYIHNGIYIRQLLFDSIVDMGGTPAVVRP
jgi:predicted CXXCH cytochrome family protein